MAIASYSTALNFSSIYHGQFILLVSIEIHLLLSLMFSCVRESRVNIAPYNFMHYVEALLRTQQAARSAPDVRASAGGDAQIQTLMQPKPSPETLEAARLRYEQELERLSARVLHVMHQRYFLVDAVEAMPSSPLVLEALDGAGASER